MLGEIEIKTLKENVPNLVMSREAYRATPGAGATFLEVEIILGFKPTEI